MSEERVRRPIGLAAVNSHPIQYLAPLYVELVRFSDMCRIVDSDSTFSRVPRLLRGVEGGLRDGPCVWRMNRCFFRAAMAWRPDIVWVEKGILLYARVLLAIAQRTGALLVASHPDDFLGTAPHMRSRYFDRAMPTYDVIFTPRHVNFRELHERGAKRVEKLWKGYAHGIVKPVTLSASEQKRFNCDVAFGGHYEPARVPPLLKISELDIDLRIWGGNWARCRNRQVRSKWRGHLSLEDYVKALCGAQIVIHFLSRWNRDTQSSRSFEIPAAKTFMLAERTDDHLACFEEGKEAEFFSSVEEMMGKVQYYLTHDTARERIADAGYRRCLKSGYSNHERVREMLRVVESVRRERATTEPLQIRR